ncbi:MAG: hypothetical protein ABSA17_07300 [Rhabdochlamydiaceae bacterium]|jgi:hypothetical protein
MQLLQVLIKKRNLNWPKTVAKCAENFVGALKGSGFQHALVDLLVTELKARSQLYIDNVPESLVYSYQEFFKKEEEYLRNEILSRFGNAIPGSELCECVCEKYIAILSSRPQHKQLPPMGFDCT